MEQIIIENKTFVKYISSQQLNDIIVSLANRINEDYKNKEVVFIVILNGAFMFAADLFKQINGLPKISFVKLASYKREHSSGEVQELIGLNENIKDKDVIIVEDIVDSGKTMEIILHKLATMKPKSLEIASLMFKTGNFTGNYKVKYIGKNISNEFIIGYGFDLDGYGRNLKDIYQLKN